MKLSSVLSAVLATLVAVFMGTFAHAGVISVSFTEVLQEGDMSPNGGNYAFFSGGPALGGAGNFVVTSRGTGPRDNPDFIVKSVSGIETIVAKDGDASPVLGLTYERVRYSPRMSGENVVFKARLSDGSYAIIIE